MESAPRLDLFLERELKHIANEGVIRADEIVCDVEPAVDGAYPGALVVTTDRVVERAEQLAEVIRQRSLLAQAVGA